MIITEFDFDIADLSYFIVDLTAITRAALPRVSGAFIVGIGRAIKSLLDVPLKSLIRPSSIKAAVKGFTGAYRPFLPGKSFKPHKFIKTKVGALKAYKAIGIADVVTDVLIKSSIDFTVLGFIPGSGLVEFGAAIFNIITGANVLDAHFIFTK